MTIGRAYPILEFDPAPEAVIEPRRQIKPIDAPKHCVICFFREVIEKAAAEKSAAILKETQWEDGPHRLYEMQHNGQRLAFLHPGVGGPVAGAMLEWAIALGCSAFVVCGGAGVLRKDIAVGHLVVPTSAVRDEGTSYHYLAPGREVEPSPEAVAAIEAALQAHHTPYITGKTWTTDAPYRETRDKVTLRTGEGCVTVEMEAASFFAVARFRGVQLGQILYGGDDVSGDEWDRRDWDNKRIPVRERLFWLAAEACLRL
jgi:uridine phosphorylase